MSNIGNVAVATGDRKKPGSEVHRGEHLVLAGIDDDHECTVEVFDDKGAADARSVYLRASIAATPDESSTVALAIRHRRHGDARKEM